MVRLVRYWLLLTIYSLVVFVGAYVWQSGGEVPAPLREPLAQLQERVTEPVVHYELVSRSCTEGRRGECQDVVQVVVDAQGMTATVIDSTLTERYEAAGGRGSRLELLSVVPAAEQFYLAEIFSSSQPRQIFRLDGALGTLTVLPWRHEPFAGDRTSPSGRFLASAAAGFRNVELFDLFTTTTSTPLRLTREDETLVATECGFAGEEPSLTWLSDSILSVGVFAREAETAQACAGALVRTVTIVVE